MKFQSFFCRAKVIDNRTKQQPTDWEEVFTNHTSNRGLISNVYRDLQKLNSRESRDTELNRILNWGNWNICEAPKEMFNIISHQENANQNNPEISPHTGQNG